MIRGRKRQLLKSVRAIEPEVQRIEAKLSCSIHNRFDIEVVDAATGRVKQRAQAENVICNQLWTRLLVPAAFFNYIHYGTGSGTPAATDTSLFAFLGYGAPTTAEDVYTAEVASGYVSLTRKIQLSETQVVGSTLTEVGIGYNSTAATLVTHAMLKDMNGNSISIAKTNTDIINIYATVFVHWNTSKYDSGYIEFLPIATWAVFSDYYGYSSLLYWMLGMHSLGGSSTLFAWFSAGNCRRDNFYGTNTTLPANRVSALTPTYNAAAKTLTLTATRLAVANCNIAGGIGCVQVGYLSLPSSSGAYAIPSGEVLLWVGGSWYSGTSITGEAIATGDGTTTDFETDFAMVSNATIKVNGVAVSSGVTVDEGIPSNLSNMGRNFILQSYRHLLSGSPWGKSASSCGLEDPGSTNYRYGDAAEAVYYNPFYSLGIESYEATNTQNNAAVAVSDDGSTWTTLSSGATGTISVPVAYQYYRYWKVWNLTSGDTRGIGSLKCKRTSTSNIHFATAPVNGNIITADYTTKTIAKDTNHVFDLTVTITLGEKAV